jgi:DNA-binding MarR family transcriptional regulator
MIAPSGVRSVAEQYGHRTVSDHPEGPFDPLLLACRRVGAAMDLFDDAACAVLGVGRSDLRALNLLEGGPMRQAEVGRRLGLSRAAVTGLVDRLEAAGHVARRRDPGDRRASLVELQPATWKAFARVYRPLGERVQASVDGLTPSERRAAADALDRIAGAFGDARAALAG